MKAQDADAQQEKSYTRQGSDFWPEHVETSSLQVDAAQKHHDVAQRIGITHFLKQRWHAGDGGAEA